MTLTVRQRKKAINLMLQAAVLGLHHAQGLHYSMGPERWQGIAYRRVAIRGLYPAVADCSSFYTWCAWNGLYVPFKYPDVVNGQGWHAGWTGTMMEHGHRVASPLPGDAVIYGPGPNGSHTAIYTGGGLVVSNGSESGPLLLPWRYRADVLSVRRYF